MLVNYLFESNTQVLLGTVALILVVAVPILWMMTWTIFRILTTKFRGTYLSTGFLFAWIAGFALVFLVAMQLVIDFRTKGFIEEVKELPSITGDTIYIDMAPEMPLERWNADLAHIDFEGVEILNDTVIGKDIRFEVVEHTDSIVKVRTIYTSRGSDLGEAQSRASNILFSFNYNKNTIHFDRTFQLGGEVWRNQQVRIVIAVPYDRTVIISNQMKYRTFKYEGNKRLDEGFIVKVVELGKQ